MNLVDQLNPNEYDIFISYSRKNIDFARKLESALNNYTPPTLLNIPQRKLKVFRDESDASGVDYEKAIRGFIEHSMKLVVICSPDARQSNFVNDEIQWFAETRGAENIIPLIVEGIPNNEATKEQAKEMAFPDQLVKAIPIPLATNYLGFNAKIDKVNKGVFDSAWYKLLSDIYGKPRSQIEERDRKQKQRRQVILTAIVSAVIISLATFAGIAWWQKMVADEKSQLAQKKETEALIAAEGEKEARIDADNQRQIAENRRSEEEKAKEVAQNARLEEEKQRNRAEGQRDLAVARQLASQSDFLLNQSPKSLTLSTLLAVESLRRSSSSLSISTTLRGLMLRRKNLFQVSDSKLEPAIVFSPNGTRMATIINDALGKSETAVVWDAFSGKELSRFHHDRGVTAVAFSPDDSRFATASYDKTARVWDITSGRELSLVAHNAFVNTVVFSPDGARLVTGSDDKTARVWNLIDGKQLSLLPHDLGVQRVVFSPNGQSIATVSGDSFGDHGETQVWDAVSGKRLFQFAHRYWAEDIAFGPRNKHFALARDLDETVTIWDTSNWEVLFKLTHDRLSTVTSVSFSPNDPYVATASDETARIWSTLDGKELLRFQHNNRVNAVSFSPNGKHLGSASDDGTARVWDTTTGEELARLPHSERVNTVVFSPDGTRIATAGINGDVLVWDNFFSVKELIRLVHDTDVVSVAYSPDGRLLATGEYKNAHIWDTNNWQELEFIPHDVWINSLVFSPTGRHLATTGSNEGAFRETGTAIWVWDVNKM